MPAKRKSRIEQDEIVRRFGARLRELRLSYGMTQAELAEKAAVATSHIWKLESGGSAPGIDLVHRFAKVFGVSVKDLLPEDEAADSTTVLQAQAKRLFDTLIEANNRDVLLALNPMLACLVESIRRRP